MNILHVITSMHPNAGGTSQAIRNIVPELIKLGSNNEIVSLDDPNDDFANNDNFIIHKLGAGITSYQYSSKLLLWIKNKAFFYDVIIVHGLWQYPNYAIFRALKKMKNENIAVPKVIIMPHGMLDPYFQKAPDRKFKALRNEIVWKLTEQKAINAAEAVFFTCEEELLLARTTFKGYEPKQEINVGFGIESSPEFSNEMLHDFKQYLPRLNNNYWLFLSRIHPKKGIDLLIDAYNQLCNLEDNIPDLVIAGPVESEYAKKMIVKAKMNTKIHFAGMLNGNAKWGAFYNCDLYILPSHQENFGIAIVEAMACKKPVLISRNINIWREIQEGKGGRILDNIEIDTIKKELKAFSLMSKNELIMLGDNAYKTFERQFNIKNRAKTMFETLKNIIKIE
jgi:glycosyltransferase involved in cell wall biosynthesis